MDIDIENSEQVRDYVLLMLGAPVIKINLDPEQLDACINTAKLETDAALSGLKITKNLYLSIFLERSVIESTTLLSKEQLKRFATKPAKQLKNWHQLVKKLRSESE